MVSPTPASEGTGGTVGRSPVRAAWLGEGQLPLPELVGLLREQGFAGPWVVDVRGLGDGAGAARRAAGFCGG